MRILPVRVESVVFFSIIKVNSFSTSPRVLASLFIQSTAMLTAKSTLVLTELIS